ncbi:hypothetical protein DAPPUDRAFT_116230 [Daphnia pulex]|uniref:Uncharacterized protein n=1 Tax=Daphnia pulex TaxID=6669 RepID=E9HNY9_DAPPU|nr:hypothetical protein DAPPUDRAFT_116230 [Daphnia pulex]|eukprot:EFX66547.1 hypothetical protein DAPPUDRAFT_116230 [Daphnia pulex]
MDSNFNPVLIEGQLTHGEEAIQFCRIDFEISALKGMNLADLKSLVWGHICADHPTEKPSIFFVPYLNIKCHRRQETKKSRGAADRTGQRGNTYDNNPLRTGGCKTHGARLGRGYLPGANTGTNKHRENFGQTPYGTLPTTQKVSSPLPSTPRRPKRPTQDELIRNLTQEGQTLRPVLTRLPTPLSPPKEKEPKGKSLRKKSTTDPKTSQPTPSTSVETQKEKRSSSPFAGSASSQARRRNRVL